MKYILGISDGHDAGASLIDTEGHIVFAATEERYTRVKHQRGPPVNAVSDIKKYLIERNEEDSVITIAIGGVFRREKRLKELKNLLHKLFPDVPCVFIGHHLAHAASAYYTSGFKESLVITLDAAGDGLSGSVSIGKDGELIPLHNLSYLDSIGDFFASITEFLGYKPMSDEHKVASMAAYASSTPLLEEMKNIIDFDERTFAFHNKLGVVGHRAMQKLENILSRENPFEVAAAAQEHLLTLVRLFFEKAVDQYGIKNVAFAGGVAGNVQLNMYLKEWGIVNDLWVFPHMGDGGIHVGAALEVLSRIKISEGKRLTPYRLSNVYLGPSFSQTDIETAYNKFKNTIKMKQIDPTEEIPKLLANNKFVGLVQGRMEFGPRALGNRSLLANPTIGENQRILNKRKGRSWFQPFAPTILVEYGEDYLKSFFESPFMTFAFHVTGKALTEIPAVIHKDKTTRPQTLSNENQRYRKILESINDELGVPAVLNTSLNIHGEPIVNTPYDALLTLKKKLVDFLVIDNYLFYY